MRLSRVENPEFKDSFIYIFIYFYLDKHRTDEQVFLDKFYLYAKN